MTFQETLTETAISNSRKKPNTPQIKLGHNFRKGIFINGIVLTFDSSFSVKGLMEIRLNGRVIIPSSNIAKYRDVKGLKIPFKDEELQIGKFIEIFIWNPTDDDAVELTAVIGISEDADFPTPELIPSDPDVINRHVSGGSTISEDAQAIIDALGESGDDNQSSRGVVFNHQVYRAETITELIDMSGNKNMIVTMSASEIILPGAIVGGGTLNTTGQSTIYDTYTNNEKELKLILSLRTFTHYASPSGSITVAVQISDDVAFGTFELVNTLTQPYQGGSNGWKSAGHTIQKTTTKRYLRIIVTSLNPNGAECYGVSLIDEKLSGGIAYLSFEIIDANGLWRTLDGMSSGDIGTISQGQNISKTFGSVSGLFIPSSQNLFRAKLHVVGGMEIGVSIIRGQ